MFHVFDHATTLRQGDFLQSPHADIAYPDRKFAVHDRPAEQREQTGQPGDSSDLWRPIDDWKVD